ncbi:hypothetical protein JFY47_05785 [Enterobacter asburiae]|jgi:hypothetical protein|uniref:hypothetical protein n=1 Tax=Enterobacter asburiae TaxID=61645 RepID=UPI0018E9F194|nr:hypothetical protein [Enterobacter asburiae]MBJ3780039.1 hypothetical protein [Enterobacter asburiae]
MLSELKNYKAEIGAGIATCASFALGETGIAHSESAAPIIGFVLSMLICKGALKLSVSIERNSLKKERVELIKKAKDLQEIAAKGEFSSLKHTIEKTLEDDLQTDIENIKKRERKIQELEREDELLTQEINKEIKEKISK